MDAWRAWLAYTFINVDKINGRYEFRDGGGGFYEMVYGFSAAQGATLMDQLGRSEDARRYLDGMATMGTTEGLFIINFGLPDHGALMNALCKHYEMTGDKEWLKSVAPTLVRMSQWIKSAREKEKAKQDPNGSVYGMIYGRPYCDHPEPSYYILADITMATGMTHAAKVLRAIRQEKDAEWIAKEGADYSADLRKILEKSVFQVDGFDLVPLFPDTRELLRANGWTTGNYYSACVGSMLEAGGDIVPLDSRIAKIIVDGLEHRGGLLMGVCRFWGGMDHAYASGYWYNRLMHGEPEKALLGLYSSMAYGMSRGTYSAVEVTFAKSAINFPTLPHSYSNLHQLKLVRNLLVLEQEGKLTIGAGVARSWLENGKHVGVRNAVTEFGKVSYRIDSHLKDSRMAIELDPPSTHPAKAIRIWLRTPAERKVAKITSDGQEVPGAVYGGEWVEIPTPKASIKLEATLAAK